MATVASPAAVAAAGAPQLPQPPKPVNTMQLRKEMDALFRDAARREKYW